MTNHRRSVRGRHRRSDGGRDHRRRCPRRRIRRSVPATTPAVSQGQRAPTLLGVPIQSLPLPGVTSASLQGETARQIDYDDEITVLGQPAPADPLAALDALVDSFDRPSITDDDEEETKVEPAETAMKAAESTDDVTTALSAQASLEREKALRRSAPAASPGQFGDDLEFADPEADDEVEDQEEEESLDDELSDEDEVISAGGAIEEEEDADDVDDGHDGVADRHVHEAGGFDRPVRAANPRRPPTGSVRARRLRLAACPRPAPATRRPPARPRRRRRRSRRGSARRRRDRPTPGARRARRCPRSRFRAPSGAAATASRARLLHAASAGAGVRAAGAHRRLARVRLRNWRLGGGKSAPAPTAVVAKPAAAPAAPVVEPVVAGSTAATGTEPKPATPPAARRRRSRRHRPSPICRAPGRPTSRRRRSLPRAVCGSQRRSRPRRNPSRVVDPLADDTAAKPKPAVATSRRSRWSPRRRSRPRPRQARQEADQSLGRPVR